MKKTWWNRQVARLRTSPRVETLVLLCRDMMMISFSCLAAGALVMLYTGAPLAIGQIISHGTNPYIDQPASQMVMDQRRDDAIKTLSDKFVDWEFRQRQRDEEVRVRDKRISDIESKQTFIEGGIFFLGSIGIIASVLKTIMSGWKKERDRESHRDRERDEED